MTERLTELPMDELDLLVEERVLLLTGRIRNCFRSAYRHLRCSWKLHHMDDEMSYFRAITAEEEAASAVILAIKQRNYNGANQLRERDHTHKAVVFQIVAAVNNLIAEIPNLPKASIQITKDGAPKVFFRISASDIGLGGPDDQISPDNPLNLRLSVEAPDGSKAPFLDEEISQLFSGTGFANFNNFVCNRANERNKILYASENGIPKIQFDDSIILERKSRVRKLAMLTIAILQDDRQHFLVKQCVEVVLTKLKNLTPTGFDFYMDETQPQSPNDSSTPIET